MANPQHPILLVDDSPEDCEATRRAFQKAGMANPLIRCADGDDALDFLYQRGPYADPMAAPRPSLILLDLNLPGTDGRDVLAIIKKDEHLKSIPVLVLTTSGDERDIEGCYRAGANSYIKKPVDMAGFLSAVQRLSGFWFEVVILPKGE